MLFMKDSMVEVYITFENLFRFLPVVDYDGSAPVINYNGTIVRCQYSRRVVRGAYRQDIYTGEITTIADRRNFWYI